MKAMTLVALLVTFTLVTSPTAMAQPAPFNEVGVTMGHRHLASKDVEGNKKLFLAMDAKLFIQAEGIKLDERFGKPQTATR